MLGIIVPRTGKAKRDGLLPYSKPPRDWGMLFFDVSSIHMVGMKFAIDVVFFDANFKVLKVSRALPGERLVTWPGAVHVLELGPDEARKFGFEVGERFRFSPNPPDPDPRHRGTTHPTARKPDNHPNV